MTTEPMSTPGPGLNLSRPARTVFLGLLLLVTVVAGWARTTVDAAAAPATAADSVQPATAPPPTPREELTAPKAVVLGVVEGVTEFLPISSTGHLLITERILDIGTTDATKSAADTYTIAIQLGAILAVLVLYWRRFVSMLEGLVGRSVSGRRILIAVIVAFLPAAVVGAVFEKKIKEHLLQPVPVIIAWAIGGVLLLVFANRWDRRHEGTVLESIELRQALLIGIAQILALWPGTSRSLVTIVAALAVGLALPAAVEFSFLLGFVTLGAATAYDMAKGGRELFTVYGAFTPLLGLVVAFVAAAVAIKWMVGYLQRHSLAIFGWYRLGVAGLALVLVLTSVI